MLSTPPPTNGYNSPAMFRQTTGPMGTPGAQGVNTLSPLGTSASSYAPPSSMFMPSSSMTPSSYAQPSSYMQGSNIPQNPDPNPQVQQQIQMIVRALQGGVR